MSGSCSSGLYTASGTSSDLNGIVYFTTYGAGVYKTNPGHATFFFPQYLTNTSSDLGGQSAPGISFDSQTATHTRQVKVTIDTTGTIYTVQPYLDPNAGTVDSSYTDIITISQTNIPQPGMLVGNVSRTGTGAGSGKIACIVNKDFDFRVFCTGQSPSGNQYPYTTEFVVQTTCPNDYVRVPKNPTVGANDDFCIAKYAMGNDGSGNAVSSLTAAGANPWTNLTRDEAVTACQALGAGYDLMQNVEWEATARDIENAYTNSQGYLNWYVGTQASYSFINMGNMGMDGNYYCNTSSCPAPSGSYPYTTYSGLPPDLDSNPCSGISAHPDCADNTTDDWAYKRTWSLSNGGVIWDFAGNAAQWLKDNVTVVQGVDDYVSNSPWNEGLQNVWGPANTYSGMNSSDYFGGLGQQVISVAAGTVCRGGNWGSGYNAGIYRADSYYDTSNYLTLIGFRCAWHVPAPNPIGLAGSSITASGVPFPGARPGGRLRAIKSLTLPAQTPPANCNTGNVISSATINGATSYAVTGLSASTPYSFLICSLSAAGGLSVGTSINETTSSSATLVSIALTPSNTTVPWGTPFR